MLSRLVDAYDRIAGESVGMGDPEFHEIEKQLFAAMNDSGYRAVIKNGDVYLTDPHGFPGEIILVDPAGPEDLDDPTVLNLDKNWDEGKGRAVSWFRPRSVGRNYSGGKNGPSTFTQRSLPLWQWQEVQELLSNERGRSPRSSSIPQDH
jgi:hypothetical protein